jgi:zinc transport system ATP-binding protein
MISCKNLQIGYGDMTLLPPFDLTIGRGEFWAVIGRNGSGKSTWLRTLLGLMPPLGGRIERSPDLKLAYLPQRGTGDDSYPVTAHDVVAMGCQRGWSFLRPSAGTQQRVQRALELMGAGELGRHRFSELSEGQRQRVLFARIAVAEPDLALLDEPTSALDLVAEREAFELLARLNAESRTTIVIVSHYVRLVSEYADNAVLLDRETPAVVSGKPRDVFAHASFRARYGGDSMPPPPLQGGDS